MLSRMLALVATLVALSQSALAKPEKLEPTAKIQIGAVDESSGLVRSRRFPGVFWTHNDSGDSPRIFAMNAEGEPVLPTWWEDDKYKGITVGHAINIDWEDIAADNDGNLYIAACGNNASRRRDLGIYILPEPDPYDQIQTRASRIVRFAYPDQQEFPPNLLNFDCEAIFWAHDHLYLLTKHRSDTFTVLYRFEDFPTDKYATLTEIARFDILGQVTGADATPDGSLLAVLTYSDIWIFQKPEDSDNYLANPIRHLEIRAKQCESICWIDSDTLLVGNEQKDLYQLKIDQLPRYSP